MNSVEDELISVLPLSTHSAVEMLHDCALYKFMIDTEWRWHLSVNISLPWQFAGSVRSSYSPSNMVATVVQLLDAHHIDFGFYSFIILF